MRRLVPRLPSPSMLVALLALFVALGGSAVAINNSKAPNNSVVTKSIKKGAVTAAKIKAGAVGAAQLGDGAVTQPKIAPGAVGAGQLGDGAVTAAKIAPNSLGPAQIDVASLNIPAPLTFTVRTVSKDFTLAVGQSAQLLSPCLPGEQLVGGGARSSNSDIVFTESFPSAPPTGVHQWFARGTNLGSQQANSSQIQSFAICAR